MEVPRAAKEHSDMPTVAQRRFPRVTVREPGELEIRFEQQGKGPPPPRVCVPVTIWSVAPEGVGVSLGGTEKLKIERGATVTIRFAGEHRKLEFPGRVVWIKDGPPMGVGVQFRLELAPAAMRQQWADWIVTTLTGAQRGPSPDPACSARLRRR
jgi:hypothetical protein